MDSKDQPMMMRILFGISVFFSFVWMEEGGRGGGGQDSRRSKRKDVDNDKVVFVGNVNFDATEEQLMSIFSQVGAVASLRLKYDRETGKPLGFGFVEVRRKKNYGFVFWFLFLFFFSLSKVSRR